MARISKLTYTVGSAYFTNINSAAIKMGGKVTNQDYVSKDGVISYTYPVINAIDIDWNEAYLANHGAYIRHSGDLLDFIDNLKTAGVDKNEIIQIINDTIPDSLSYFTNDVGYITAAALRNYVTEDDIRNNESLRGLSAYQIAQQVYEQNGRVFPYANEEEWIESLHGKDGSGDGGSQSISYISELINDVGYITAGALRNYVTEDDIRNNDTLRGLSAYQIAQQVYEQNGRVFPYANEEEWIESLHGKDGSGDGSSQTISYISELINDVGYITAATLRNYVTEDDIRNNESLRGLSAYQVAQKVYEQNGRVFPYANEEEWLESLRGDSIDVDEILAQIEEIARRTTTVTSVELDNEHRGLTLSYSYSESFDTVSYVLGLTHDFLPTDIFNETYEKLYNPASYASIAYIAREVLAYELIPAYAHETLDTLEEISYWIQNHPDEYNYVLSNIDILHDNISYINNELDETVEGSLAYNVAQLDIDKLITVKVDAEANKIESITVNNELQDIYELDEDHKKNVNIQVPITAIYDNTRTEFSYINPETHVAYIGLHKYDTDDIQTTAYEFSEYDPVTDTSYQMSLTEALSILSDLANTANSRIDDIVSGNSGVNSISSDGSLLINGSSDSATGDVTISATGYTIPLGYDLTNVLDESATPTMPLGNALAILAEMQKRTDEKVLNHEDRITTLENNMSYINWQIVN